MNIILTEVLIYTYDPETFEFISSEQAGVDPERLKTYILTNNINISHSETNRQPISLDNSYFLLPKYATFLPPPTVQLNQKAVFNADSGVWGIVKDFRGTVYWDNTGKEHVIEQLDQEVPTDCVVVKPELFFYKIETGEHDKTATELRPGLLQTTLVPPIAGINQVAVFEDGGWTLVPDFRGLVYDKDTQVKVIYYQLGPLPSNLTISEPPFVYCSWINDSWQIDIAKYKAYKEASFEKLCQEKIVSGIESDVLGTMHYYPTKLIDQHNMRLNSDLSTNTNSYQIWCRDADGNWTYVVHTSQQFVAVYDLMIGFIAQCRQYYASLLEQLRAPNLTIADIDNINWE